MKKIFILLLLVCLMGCAKINDFIKSDELLDMGYDEKTVSMIEEYGIRENVMKYPYNENLKTLIEDPSFIKENIDEYLSLNELKTDDCLMVVNRGYTDDVEEYSEDLLNLMRTDYYLHSRHQRYLEMVNNGYSYRDAIEIVNAYRDYEAYTYTIDSNLGDDILMIANKYYTLNDYVPDDLVSIDGNYGIEGYMREEAYNAYVKMADDASMDGMSLWITSPYRSYSSQNRIYNSYLENDPQYIVDTYSSRPGYSDHQTGLTADIIAPGYDFGSFAYSDEFKWLSENAYKYGFILSYPKGKENITGYTYESWHYRYVGEKVASYIHDTGITFDEYYAYFISGEH